MIKQARQQVPSIPKPPPVPAETVSTQSGFKGIIIGAGKNKINSLCHGGNITILMSSLSAMIAQENEAGYSYLQSIPVNNGEMVVVFGK
jgi:hypothetical protein